MKSFLNKIFVGISFLSMVSCTVFEDPAPVFEEEPSSLNINKRRVLLINVDGAIGEVVKEVMPPKIASLLENSKYTFAGLSDGNSHYAPTWATIAKGVEASKHHVENDEFTTETDDDHLHETIPYYPSFMYRLEEVKPHYKSSIMMRDSVLARELFNEVENRHFFETDVEVSNYAESYLKTTKDMLMVVQFSSVMEAGRQTGFSSSNPAYVTAINTVDGYIGKLVDAVKARETYADEEWLIMVQSNNGGFGNETGGEELEAKNIFMILNYPRFQSYEFTPRYLSGSRFFKISRSRTDYDSNGAEATNSTAYNMSGDEMTVEFFLKANEVYAPVSNTFVFGKSIRTNQNGGSDGGWFFVQRGMATGFFCQMSDNTSLTTFDGFAPYTKGKWDHMAVTIKKTGTTVNRSIYTNGELTKSDNFTVAANATITSSAPFRIQHGLEHNSYHSMDTELSEIRIFNKALTAEQIARHACLLALPEDDDTYANLIGYYPLKEDFNNKILSGPNLVPIGNADPDRLPASSVVTYCDSAEPQKVTLLGNTDVAPLIFYWLRQRYETYGWSAANPLKPFELEFLGSDNN